MILFESKDEIDRTDEEDTRHEMVPTQRHLKGDGRECDKDHEGDHFLDNLQLHQREWSAVPCKTDSVGRHLEAVLEESDAPGQENHKDKRCGIGEETGLLQFQMTVPRERHEDIRRQE